MVSFLAITSPFSAAQTTTEMKTKVRAYRQANEHKIVNELLDLLSIPNLASNLKFFFEGEEEAGSPHLEAIVAKYFEQLKADAWILCDGPAHQTRKQQPYFGARGIISFELTVYGANRELHSDHYGNWAPNPAMPLSQL